MQRSLSFEEVREAAWRSLKVAGGGLAALAVSAVLISFRILLCDDTDIIWDNPELFFEIVKMAYSPDNRSEWGPLWDIGFAIVPMWVYVACFAPRIWDPEDDEYASFRRGMIPWEQLRQPAAPLAVPASPELEWGYAEYEVTRPEEPVFRSRTPTLRGFPAPRPPARSQPTQEEIDKGWEELK